MAHPGLQEIGDPFISEAGKKQPKKTIFLSPVRECRGGGSGKEGEEGAAGRVPHPEPRPSASAPAPQHLQ